MRLLQNLKADLTSMLQVSPTWRRLLRGLVGQELLSWGAAVVYLDDLAYDSLTHDLHPSSASDLGLSLLSASYSVPFQSFTPGTLLYSYLCSTALKPYSLVYTFNATSWFNTKSVLVDASPQVLELFQGVPLAMVSAGASFQNTFENISEVLEVRTSDVFMDEDRTFFYVKLRGSNIMPDSVRVQVLTVLSVQQDTFKASFMPSDEFSSEDYFSVYTLPDGSQAVRFHKAIPDLYQITYFSASMEIPDPMEGVGSDGNPVRFLSNPSVSNEAKRSDFIKAMSEFSAISTLVQIEAFCRASGVVDAKAIRTSSGKSVPEISVFFIPVSQDYSVISHYQNSLSEALGLYGSFSFFKVSPGYSIPFQVKVSSRDSVLDMSSVTDAVKYYFSTKSPESFSRPLSELLTVYLHDEGFSDIRASFLLRLGYSNISFISKLGGLMTNYLFYKDGVVDRHSYGSQIIGLSTRNVVFRSSDTYFIMTDAVFVQQDSLFYIFSNVTKEGSFLSLEGFTVLAAGGDTIIFSKAGSSAIFTLSMSPEEQLYACTNGVLPQLLRLDVPEGAMSSLRIYDEGFFSLYSGENTILYQILGNSISSLGRVPSLLFVYAGRFYYLSNKEYVILCKSSPTSNLNPVEVNLRIHGTSALTEAEFLKASITIKDDVLTAKRASDGVIFLFSVSYNNNSFILNSFASPISEGVYLPLMSSKVPASWVNQKPCVYSFTATPAGWKPLSVPQFSEKKGSILSDGTPLFDDAYVYDYVTVETTSVKSFSNSYEAVFFSLDSSNPVTK